MNYRIRYICSTGILAALSYLLQLFEFPIPLMPSFIKLDFSDFPALIGAFAFGPVCGIIIELVKNLLHSLVSQSFAVGELSNFLLGAVFSGTAGFIYSFKKTRNTAILASLSGALMMSVFSLPINYFIVYPVYYNFMAEDVILSAYQMILPSVDSILKSLLIFNVPFTFFKGIFDVLLTFLIYHRISGLLHGRN